MCILISARIFYFRQGLAAQMAADVKVVKTRLARKKVSDHFFQISNASYYLNLYMNDNTNIECIIFCHSIHVR